MSRRIHRGAFALASACTRSSSQGARIVRTHPLAVFANDYAFKNTDSYTIACRVLDTGTLSHNSTVFGWNSPERSTILSVRRAAGAAGFGMRLENSTGAVVNTVQSSTGHGAQSWVSLCLTHENSTFRLYVNGSLTHTVTQPGMDFSSGNFGLFLGGIFSGDQAYGRVYDYLLVNKGTAYTAAQASSLAVSVSLGDITDALDFWSFNADLTSSVGKLGNALNHYDNTGSVPFAFSTAQGSLLHNPDYCNQASLFAANFLHAMPQSNEGTTYTATVTLGEPVSAFRICPLFGIKPTDVTQYQFNPSDAQYSIGTGAFLPISLDANLGNGVTTRIEPYGVLPAGTRIRFRFTVTQQIAALSSAGLMFSLIY